MRARKAAHIDEAFVLDALRVLDEVKGAIPELERRADARHRRGEQDESVRKYYGKNFRALRIARVRCLSKAAGGTTLTSRGT